MTVKREQITKLLQDGELPRAIKAKLKVSGQYINTVAKGLNMPPFKRGRKFGELGEHSNSILKAWDAANGDASFTGIAKRFKVSKQCVHQLVRRYRTTS